MSIPVVTRGEHTRQLIRDAAYELFLDLGYHGTSMRQIARHAGTALGGIYNHFSSKEEIFLEVIKAHHPYVKTLPALESASGTTIDTFVRDAARHMIDALGDHLEFVNLMFIELVEFKGRHLSALFDQFFPGILEFAQRFSAQRQGLRPIPPLILVRVFLGLFYSYVLTELLIADRLPEDMRQDAFPYFVDVFLHGILVEPEGGNGGKP
jgi:AcrR family transcriptional regulator